MTDFERTLIPIAICFAPLITALVAMAAYSLGNRRRP